MSATVSIDDETGQRALERCPTLFVVLHGTTPLAPASRHLLRDVDVVRLGRGSVFDVRRSGPEVELLVPDLSMSTRHAVLKRTPSGGYLLEDEGSKNGTIVGGKRIDAVSLSDRDVFCLGHTFFLHRSAMEVEADAPFDQRADELPSVHPGLVTFGAPLIRLYNALAVVAPSTVPILVGGETGTGKELVARAAHALSKRSGAFVAVNCGALPATLVESELFGYRRGAFSGATHDRPGLVRAADHGTLFLDEIGDLSLPAQTALLRVLQEREVTPVGSTQSVKVDFRLISATHKDLRKAAAHGRFRSDLLARLTGLVVSLPPLRDRREDPGIIIGALLVRSTPLATVGSIRFSVSGARFLFERPFHRNVRELERMLETAVLLAGDRPISEEHLVAAAADVDAAAEPELEPDAPLSPEDQALREKLVELFREHQGNVSAVGPSAREGAVPGASVGAAAEDRPGVDDPPSALLERGQTRVSPVLSHVTGIPCGENRLEPYSAALMLRSHVCALTLAIALSAISLRAWCDVPTDATIAARELFKQARAAMDREDYVAACPKLEEATRLDPGAVGILLNLAVCHEKVGKTATARVEFEQARSLARKQERPERITFAEEHLAALEPRISKLRIVVPPHSPNSLRVLRDGVLLGQAPWGEPIAVDPGEHTIVIQADGHASRTVTIAITTEGVVETLTLEPLEPLPRDPRDPPAPASTGAGQRSGLATLGIATFGVGLASIVSSGVLGALAIDADRRAGDGCVAGRCSTKAEELNERAKTFADIATVVGFTGLALSIAGSVLYLVSHRDPPRGAVAVW